MTLEELEAMPAREQVEWSEAALAVALADLIKSYIRLHVEMSQDE